MEWGARYQDSKILEDLQNVIDSGETRLCVTIFVDVTAGGIEGYPNIERRTNLYEFLVQQGVDVEGQIRPDGKKEISARLHKVIDAAIPLSLLDEIANRDDVINIDVMGKDTNTPYHKKNKPGFQDTTVTAKRDR